ncbi:hypothetical protein ACLKMY_00560 [Paraburkholderia mimosarum]|uniref:hypothetical protein n=1 Tax=Paraburkholderia mimosarum TaxID=312026 RepID=UPI0039C31F4A
MINVYSRLRGKVICHVAQTDDPAKAIDAVARRFNEVNRLYVGSGASSRDVNMRLSATRWSLGPFLAVVPA